MHWGFPDSWESSSGEPVCPMARQIARSDASQGDMPPGVHGRRLPEGPKGQFLLGNLREFRADPLGFLAACARRYGPVTRIRMGPFSAYLVSDPDLIRSVLVDKAAAFSKENIHYRRLRPVIGRGLLASDGPRWRHQRVLVQPLFGPGQSQNSEAFLLEEIRILLEDWEARGDRFEFDVLQEMASLTIRATGRGLLGSDLASQTGAIHRAFSLLNEQFGSWRISSLFPWLWTPANSRCWKAVASLNGVADELLRGRHRSEAAAGPLLTILETPRAGGIWETAQEKRDEILTLLLSGYETTAALLAWTLHLLASHPQADARLHADIQHRLHGRLPTSGDLKHLGQVRMVIDESLRLYPPVWILSRTPTADVALGPFRIPAGSLVLVSPYVTHRLAEFWEEPEQFRPERFASGPRQQRHHYVFLPFGGGPRVCVGRESAMFQSQLVLTSIIQRFRFVPADSSRVTPEPWVTLRPGSGLRLLAVRR